MHLKLKMHYQGPREKIWKNGARLLTDAELLALILGTGPRHKQKQPIPSVVLLAEDLIKQFGSLRNLLNATPEELLEKHGVGKTLASRILAQKEIATRFQSIPEPFPSKIDNPEKAQTFFRWMAEEETEIVCALFLSASGNPIRMEEIFRGGITECSIHIREIFRVGLRANAASFILAHNHPSGELTPSEEDLKITVQLQEMSELLGIPLLDHLIISKFGYFSFAEGMGTGEVTQ